MAPDMNVKRVPVQLAKLGERLFRARRLALRRKQRHAPSSGAKSFSPTHRRGMVQFHVKSRRFQRIELESCFKARNEDCLVSKLPAWPSVRFSRRPHDGPAHPQTLSRRYRTKTWNPDFMCNEVDNYLIRSEETNVSERWVQRNSHYPAGQECKFTLLAEHRSVTLRLTYTSAT